MEKPSVILGVETSGPAGSAALVIDGAVQGERELSASGRRHARTLIPELDGLLRSAGLAPRDVTLMAVSMGPGSFTGLRVGVVCAKTFAYAVGCRLVGVDTFLAVAAEQSPADALWVIDDALRGDLFAGRYRHLEGGWKEVDRPRLLPLEEWRANLATGDVVTGPGVEKLADLLAGLEQSGVPLGPVGQRLPRARQIALLGGRQAASGRVDDPWRLEPLYMRRSAAEEKADAREVAVSTSAGGANFPGGDAGARRETSG